MARNALFIGEHSAQIYAELPDDHDIYGYKSCYMGTFRRTNSFARVIAVNPLHADDLLILNYELTLKPAKAFTGFGCTLSIGHWFPLALPILDTLKWYNFIEKTTDKAGKVTTRSVQKSTRTANALKNMFLGLFIENTPDCCSIQ